MEKKTLVLDSQQLTSFQKCPRRYFWDFVENLEGKFKAPALVKGSCISDALEAYYNARIAKLTFEECVAAGLGVISAFDFSLLRFTEEKQDNEVDLRFHLTRKFIEYCGYYKAESIIPVATEQRGAFSKILYEDAHHLFIYEGKPDWIGKPDWRTKTLHWMDHKSTMVFGNQLHGFTNQFLGYSWALECKVGVINHFGLMKTASPEKSFYRQPIEHSAADVKDWVDSAVTTCFEIIRARELWEMEMGRGLTIPTNLSYSKRRASCETKYGLCLFHKLCDTQSLYKIDQLKRMDYKVKETEWRAWKVETGS